MIENKDRYASNSTILDEIRFSYITPYKVAGMGEPWYSKVEMTQQLLFRQGIGAILTLTEDDPYGPQHKAAGFMHHHEPMDDGEAPSVESTERALKFMDTCLKKGHGVAVHCLEGRSRTGTILCAWLAIKESLDLGKAIERIYRQRPFTVITPPQRHFLRAFLDGVAR